MLLTSFLDIILAICRNYDALFRAILGAVAHSSLHEIMRAKRVNVDAKRYDLLI